jgi:hypothetical protein
MEAMIEVISFTPFDELTTEPVDLDSAMQVYGADQDALDAWVDRQIAVDARNAERFVDYDYELRHPGHADQSVHNPQPNTGKFKQDVIKEYGKAAGSKP